MDVHNRPEWIKNAENKVYEPKRLRSNHTAVPASTVDDDEVPTSIRWCLQCSSEVAVGGDILVPQGPVYFNAFTTAERRQRGLDAGCGRVTIREDSSLLSALFGTRGLIEEFATVGRLEIKPRGPV